MPGAGVNSNGIGNIKLLLNDWNTSSRTSANIYISLDGRFYVPEAWQEGYGPSAEAQPDGSIRAGCNEHHYYQILKWLYPSTSANYNETCFC